jgi:DNA-binding transcriptional regulator LsrR (DeoR family)
MPAARERDLLVKAARLYYQDNCSQQEVASALGVSRSNVSRMLAAARAQGIVEIRIHDPAGRELGLEDELKSAFGLTACRVVAVRPDEPSLPKVGELAADWLLDTARPGEGISLSWGSTLQAMVYAVHAERAVPVDVRPLVGGLSSIASEVMGEELIRELADRLGGTFQRLHAPALLESKAARDTLMAESSISSVLKAASRSSLAFVGIGAAGVGSSAAIIESLRLSRRDRAQFEKAEPVGDVCARYFDEDGLRRIRTVVGLAAGVEKARGVLGALRGRYLDVVVCDAPLAKALLAQAA